MRFIDLFSGLGGFHLAAKRLGMDCVFACEVDAKLRDLYELNFGIRPEGDIRDIDPSSVPPHEALFAGFPCQPFSKAGNQLGFKDKIRGTIAFNMIRIIKHHKPRLIVLENVAHFVRHDNGKTLDAIKSALEDLNYEVESATLSPHQFGVPQIRERMYLVARSSSLKGFSWPRKTTRKDELSIMEILDVNPTPLVRISAKVERCLEVWQEFLERFPQQGKLPSFPIWSMEFGATYPYEAIRSIYDLRPKVLRRCKGIFGESLNKSRHSKMLELLPSYAKREHDSFPLWKQQFIRQNRQLYSEHKLWIDRWIPKIREFSPSLQKLEWNCQGEERDIWRYIIQIRASGVRVKRPDTSPSLVAMTTTQIPIIGWERRYMTIRECARLQSMDDLKYLPEGIAGFKALGNAVNVKVVRLILRNLIRCERLSVAA